MNVLDQTLNELENQFEFEQNEYESSNGSSYEQGHDTESPFSEEEEMELASELLEVTNDEELDEFLGKIWGGVKKFAKSSAGRALGGVLKGIAKKALPIAGGALGTFFGGPAGGMIGGKLGSVASNLFELELEGMSPEDQEFEVAKRFVRFAGEAAKNTAKIAGKAPDKTVVKIAMTKAAKKHAPGLLKQSLPSFPKSGNQSGRWIKRGRRIILMGV